jgi:mRNA interferase RelE/StbE
LKRAFIAYGGAVYRLRLSTSAEELLRGLHPELKRKIRAGLDAIREDPVAGKELHDDLTGLRSFRVGRFRIIYRIGPRRLIEVVALGPRRTIYGETFRRIRRDRRSP